MKIVYIAEDGKTFDNQIDCELYEKSINYKAMYNIKFIDIAKRLYKISPDDPYNDNIYQDAWEVILKDFDQVRAIQFLAEECGWCEFESLTEPGIWVRKADDYKHIEWKKVAT